MSLLHQWKCQDNAASTTVVATVGTNATLAGGDNTSAKASAGPGTALASAFSLNGTDDEIDISAASVSFAAGSAFSLSIWFYDNASVGRYFGTSGSGNGFVRKTNATTIEVRNATATVTFTVASITTGAWHHLLVTRTAGNSVRVFVDGVESSTGALANANTFAVNRFGMQNTNFHNGAICGVGVYDSDESANVATIMAEKDSGTPARANVVGGGVGGRVV